MADKKEIVVEKKEVDINKQVANLAYTVRKIKNWLEEKMGADIDGDGRVGSGPLKKIGVALIAFGLAVACVAAPYNTNISIWYGTEAVPVTFVDGSGRMIANYFVGDGSLLTGIAATALPDTLVSNVTIAITSQGAPSVTNASVALTRQVNLGMTNIVLQTGVVTQVVDGVTNAITVVTNATIQTTLVAALTNAVLTVQSAVDAALTNAVLTIQRVP